MATTTPHYFSLHFTDTPVSCSRFVWTGGYVSRFSVLESDRLCQCGFRHWDHAASALVGGKEAR